MLVISAKLCTRCSKQRAGVSVSQNTAKHGKVFKDAATAKPKNRGKRKGLLEENFLATFREHRL